MVQHSNRKSAVAIPSTSSSPPVRCERPGKVVPDILQPGLDALFVGINPGLISAREGHHFANPANAFWRLMHESGISPRRLSPHQERELLESGVGLTNLVDRESPGVSSLTREDFDRGRAALARTIDRFRPKAVVFVGITTYRQFARKPAVPIACGEQPERLCGARVFVVPNPSGRNAHFSYADMLALFRQVAQGLGKVPRS